MLLDHPRGGSRAREVAVLLVCQRSNQERHITQ